MLKQIAMHNNRVKVSYDYDSFYRSTKSVLLNTNYSLTTAYNWRQGTDSSHTSYMPSGQTETLKNASNNTVATTSLSYTYDVLGNIETISEGGVQRQKYYYDSLNQLIREDNLDLNKTFVYSYDLGGNITSTKEYAYQTGAAVTGTATTTNSYTYGDSNWKDKLTAYNGSSISYDAIGNPLSYYNGFTFTWQKGRQLASATNGTTSVTYTYNNDGYRTAKTINGTTTDYTLEGNRVLIEKTGSDYVWFYYDAAGAPVAMATGSGPSLYIYRKNLQGDITGIYSGSTGTLLVSYVYDAWGKVTATNVAGTTESATVLARNPYLYRGYRYDSETGLYYLNSRYYDPETGRFINADGFVSTGQGILGSNMFAYCLNNPVNGYDPGGYAAKNAFYTYENVRNGGLLFVCLVLYAAKVLTLTEKTPRPATEHKVKTKELQVAKRIEDIARSYPKEGQCDNAAAAMDKAAKKKGIIVTLDFPKDDPLLKYADNVYNIEYGITVGNNRYHKGYYYNGLIYCPVYPEGKPPILWKNSFICDGCTKSVIIPRIEWLP